MGSSGARAEPAAPMHGRAMGFSAALQMGTGNPDPPPAQGANSGFGARRRKLLLLFQSCVLSQRVSAPYSSLMAAPLPGFGFTGGDAARASNRVALLAAAQR